MMKKIFTYFLCFLFLFNKEAKADAWNVNRNICLGALYYKFHAYGRASYNAVEYFYGGVDCLGRTVGGPFDKVINVDYAESKGCSRPQVAKAMGIGWVKDLYHSGCYLTQIKTDKFYYAHGRAYNEISGWSVDVYTEDYGAAGAPSKRSIKEEEYKSLNIKGFTSANVSGGEIQIENNKFFIPKINGEVKISKESDLYSTFKIIGIIERNDYNEEELLNQDSLLSNGVFENIVYEAELTVYKDQIIKTGIFKKEIENIEIIDDFKEYGVKFKDLNIAKELNLKLKDYEELTIITFSDGGPDIRSALNEEDILSTNENNLSNLFAVEIFPNPSNNVINLELKNLKNKTTCRIDIVNIDGKKIKNIYNGKLPNGQNYIPNIDISKLKSGFYILEIEINNRTYYEKFIKQ